MVYVCEFLHGVQYGYIFSLFLIQLEWTSINRRSQSSHLQFISKWTLQTTFLTIDDGFIKLSHNIFFWNQGRKKKNWIHWSRNDDIKIINFKKNSMTNWRPSNNFLDYNRSRKSSLDLHIGRSTIWWRIILFVSYWRDAQISFSFFFSLSFAIHSVISDRHFTTLQK